MAVSKTARTLQASATNTAGSTTTGSAVNLTTALGLAVTAKVTNGGTGPTVACSVYIDVSNDNSTWATWASGIAGVANSGVYEFSWELPPQIMYARARFTGNTGQSVTVEAYGHELTGL